MTSNHLLLYRLAELMLEHEQHILPVDLLFDDEKIGDLVKSIQIDSPYQQMLLEGVLTESVREEKLYVSFTVEGYFHYVLGEVIYNKTQGKGAEALKKIVDNNKLNGAKEGVEQCLIRDVQKDDLTRLIWMIDHLEHSLELCRVPLAYTFIKKYNESYHEDISIISQGLNSILKDLFQQPGRNDFEILDNTIEYLELNQKHHLISLINIGFNQFIKPSNLFESIRFAKSINYIQPDLRFEQLNMLYESTINFHEDDELAYLFYILAQLYMNIAEYDMAIKSIRRALKLIRNIYGEQHISYSACYHYLGDIWREKGEYDKAIDNYYRSLNFKLNSNLNFDQSIGETYNNIGITLIDKSEYDQAIQILETSLQIHIEYCGKTHSSTATVYSNLGLAYNEKGESSKAIFYYEKVLAIDLMVHGLTHPLTGIIYNNLGSVCNSIEKYDDAIMYYEKSLLISIETDGVDHPSTAVVYDNLGTTWYCKTNYLEARVFYEKAFNIRLNRYGDQHVSTAKSFNNLGNILSAEGKKQDALELYQKAHQIFKNKLGETHQYTVLVNQKINDLNDL
jgi:tetratricopeptide (TPR) repeat protein